MRCVCHQNKIDNSPSIYVCILYVKKLKVVKVLKFSGILISIILPHRFKCIPVQLDKRWTSWPICMWSKYYKYFLLFIPTGPKYIKWIYAIFDIGNPLIFVFKTEKVIWNFIDLKHNTMRGILGFVKYVINQWNKNMSMILNRCKEAFIQILICFRTLLQYCAWSFLTYRLIEVTRSLLVHFKQF